MTTFETLKQCKASLIIEEYNENDEKYKKAVVIRFDDKNEYKVRSYRAEEIMKNDKEKRSRIFYELFLIRVITMSIAILVFIIFFCLTGKYILYFQILLLELLANIFDISWVYQGMEDFKRTVFKNFVIRLTTVISIFVFVKSPDDLWKYFLIYALNNLVGNLSLWIKLKDYISYINFFGVFIIT